MKQIDRHLTWYMKYNAMNVLVVALIILLQLFGALVWQKYITDPCSEKRDISGKITSSSLFKHNIKYQNDTQTQSDRFTCKTVFPHQFWYNRLLTEAHSTANSKTQMMNSKNEYGAGKLIYLEPAKFTEFLILISPHLIFIISSEFNIMFLFSVLLSRYHINHCFY